MATFTYNIDSENTILGVLEPQDLAVVEELYAGFLSLFRQGLSESTGITGFIFRGVAPLVSAISDPTLPGRGWEIFIGVISLIAGVIMLAVPFESLAILTQVVGIWLIVLGAFEVVSAFGIRSASKKMTEFRQEGTGATTE